MRRYILSTVSVFIISIILLYLVASEELFFFNFDRDIIWDSYFINSVFQNGLFDSYLQPILTPNYGWPSQAKFHYPTNEWTSLALLKMIILLSNGSLFEALNYFVLIGLILNFITFYFITRILNLNRFLSLILAFTYSLNLFLLSRMSIHIFFTQIWIVNIALVPFFLILRKQISIRNSTKFLSILVSSFLLALSNNYFILFTFILYLILFIYLFYRFLLSEDRIAWVLDGLLTISFIILTLIFNSISLTGLLRSQPMKSLLKITDSRQDVESLMYSGSPFSLLNYQNSFLSDIFHWNFRTYSEAYSLIQPGWTDSVGNRFELQILLVLICIAIGYNRKFRINLFDSTTKFLILCLFISLGWFIQGGFGFLFSVFISNSVRGWGRFVFIVVLFSTLLIGVIITSILREIDFKLSNLLILSVVFILLIVPIIKDISSLNFAYNKSHYTKVKQNQDIFFSKLISLPKGCSVVILPHYPFPEFDRSGDRLNDYDLYVPLNEKSSNFNWNIGAIKWTEYDRWWSPLASDVPNFASTDPLTQIAYASHYGACAVALNMGVFSSKEEEISSNFLSSIECSLLGDINDIEPSRSWLIWDLRNEKCRSLIKQNANLAANTFSTDLDGPLLWRFTNVSPEYYSSNFPVFDSSTRVELDFMSVSPKKRLDYPSLTLRNLASPNNKFLEFSICFHSEITLIEQCEALTVDQEETRLSLNKYLDSNLHKITIIPKDNRPGIKWATLITY